MNRFSQFFHKIKDKILGKKSAQAPTAFASTVPAPMPEQVIVERTTIKHPLGIGHSMHRLKGIGGHPVRPVCSTRAFKDAFYHDYGVRLT